MGVNAAKEAILERVAELGPDVVGLSALLTPPMPAMAKTVAAFKEAAHPTPVIVGGAPVTQVFARTIGADGYGENAPAAVLKVGQLVGARGNAEPAEPASTGAYCAV
jgi:5-methyltetrahydrofolate--homocysteine methyltransferase